MSNVLITGANGFIGNRLAKKLAADGITVHALIRDKRTAVDLIHPNIKIFYGDITQVESVRKAITGCENVYHIAGYAKLYAKNRDVFYEVNVKGTANVLEQALKAGVKKLVYTSSAAVYGPSLKLPLCENAPELLVLI